MLNAAETSAFRPRFRFAPCGPDCITRLRNSAAPKRIENPTHAACQTVQHFLKIFAFTALGFAFADWLPLIAAMIASGFLGTIAGTRLLERLPERWFLVTVKAALTLIGLDLLRRAAGY